MDTYKEGESGTSAIPRCATDSDLLGALQRNLPFPKEQVELTNLDKKKPNQLTERLPCSKGLASFNNDPRNEDHRHGHSLHTKGSQRISSAILCQGEREETAGANYYSRTPLTAFSSPSPRTLFTISTPSLTATSICSFSFFVKSCKT